MKVEIETAMRREMQQLQLKCQNDTPGNAGKADDDVQFLSTTTRNAKRDAGASSSETARSTVTKFNSTTHAASRELEKYCFAVVFRQLQKILAPEKLRRVAGDVNRERTNRLEKIFMNALVMVGKGIHKEFDLKD